MGMDLAMIGASAGASIAGGAAANAMDPSSNNNISLYSTPQFVNTMNQMLSSALTQATATNNSYDNAAVAQQNQSLNNSTQALNNSLTNATTSATNSLQNGFNTSQALQAPYANAGYNALDSYEDSLGLSRPVMGAGALAANLNQAQTQSAAIQALPNIAGKIPANPGAAPTLASFQNPTATQLGQDYINQYGVAAYNAKANAMGSTTAFNNSLLPATTAQTAGQDYINQFGASLYNQEANAAGSTSALNNMIYQNPQSYGLLAIGSPTTANALTTGAFNAATNTYNTNEAAYNNAQTTYQQPYNTALSAIQYNPQAQQIAQQYANGQFAKS